MVVERRDSGDSADVDLRQVNISGTPCALSAPYGATGVHHSNIDGNMRTEWNGAVHLSHSEFTGKVIGDGQSCFASCDAEMNPLDEGCQPIRH